MTSVFMSRDFIDFEEDDKDGGMKELIRKIVVAVAVSKFG